MPSTTNIIFARPRIAAHIRRTAIATALLSALASPAFADEYYLVVPVQNRTATTGNISVTLNAAGLPAGQVGEAYAGFDFNSLLQVKGDPNFSNNGVRWSLASGALPAGLVLGTNGRLSGTPTAGGASSFQVISTYKTKAGQQRYQVSVVNLVIDLAGAALPAGVQGTPYSQDLKALLTVSGDPSYSPSNVAWTLESGALPAGLTLGTSGAITGTPTAEGTYPFTVRAAYKNRAGARAYEVAVGAITVTLAGASLPAATVGQAFSYDLTQQLTVQGDAAYAAGDAVSWAVASGSLPAGLSVGADGKLAGTPTALGSKTASITATYKAKSASATYTIPVIANVATVGSYRAWSDGKHAPSCKAYKTPAAPYFYLGSTGDGVYRIQLDGGATVDVYCDMTRDGGGWMLAYNQKGDTHTHLTARNAAVVTPAAAGSHAQMAKLFSASTEFRWTDEARVRFLQGRTNMAVWFNKITTHDCSAGGNTIDVSFENGWFNTGSAPRKVEACIYYPFGMRNNMPFATFTDVPGYNNASTHMCWVDDRIELRDRPFASSHDDYSPARSYCTQFGYSFPASAGRGGTMHYQVWVR